MFFSVFSVVATMLIYMAVGFVLCKTKLAVPAHAKSMSGLLIYVLGPLMLLNSFLTTEYSIETLIDIGKFFAFTLIFQAAFFAAMYLIFHKKYEDAKYRILSVGSVLGNVGFFGIPVISSIFPDQPIVTCYSSIYVLSMNLLVFTMGTFLITNDKKWVSIKSALLNPTTIAIAISLPLFIFQVDLPDILDNSISALAKMVTPMCMIILGMRLAQASIKELFTRKFVYLTCAVKLVIFPLLGYLCAYFLPVSTEFKVSVLVLSAAPTGAIVQSMAELHECEQELTANVVLLTTILSVITVPLLVLILV